MTERIVDEDGDWAEYDEECHCADWLRSMRPDPAAHKASFILGWEAAIAELDVLDA